MFPNFPWTNFHRLNADWILQTVQNAVDTVTHAVERIESALSTVDGLTSRVTALEASTQQLQSSVEALDARVNGAFRRILTMETSIETMVTSIKDLDERVIVAFRRIGDLETSVETMVTSIKDLDERVIVAFRRLGDLETSVETLEGAMAGKVSNGNNTIIGAANQLTVSGVNSGEEVSINGSSVTITGTGSNDVRLALDTAGEPGASESVLRLVRHDDTSPGPVRITNVGPGSALTDAVNVEQITPMLITLIGDYSGSWTGATWADVMSAYNAGRVIRVTYSGVTANCLPHLQASGNIGLQVADNGGVSLASDGSWNEY